MTGWDIYDCHRCPKNKFKLKKKNFFFFWSGSPDPTYVRGVKRAGDRGK
jgi:hypothetical protein